MLDTALPPSVQVQFERALRDVIAGFDDQNLEFVRQVPPPDSDDLDLELTPELARFTVSSLATERTVGVHLFFLGEPDGAVDVIPETVEESDEAVPVALDEREPTTLEELGGGYAALSEAVGSTLSDHCRPSTDGQTDCFDDDQVSLRCTSRYGRLYTFSATVSYPEQREQVAAEDSRDVVSQFLS